MCFVFHIEKSTVLPSLTPIFFIRYSIRTENIRKAYTQNEVVFSKSDLYILKVESVEHMPKPERRLRRALGMRMVDSLHICDYLHTSALPNKDQPSRLEKSFTIRKVVFQQNNLYIFCTLCATSRDSDIDVPRVPLEVTSNPFSLLKKKLFSGECDSSNVYNVFYRLWTLVMVPLVILLYYYMFNSATSKIVLFLYVCKLFYYLCDTRARMCVCLYLCKRETGHV